MLPNFKEINLISEKIQSIKKKIKKQQSKEKMLSQWLIYTFLKTWDYCNKLKTLFVTKFILEIT